MAVDHVGRRHDHARRAEAALQAVMFLEGRLHRMQVGAVGQTFDRHDRRPGSLDGQHGAGLHRLAVDMDDAGAALRGVAADMGAGKAEIFAQEMNQKRSVLGSAADPPPVHRQRYVRHESSLGTRPWSFTSPIAAWRIGYALFVYRTTPDNSPLQRTDPVRMQFARNAYIVLSVMAKACGLSPLPKRRLADNNAVDAARRRAYEEQRRRKLREAPLACSTTSYACGLVGAHHRRARHGRVRQGDRRGGGRNRRRLRPLVLLAEPRRGRRAVAGALKPTRPHCTMPAARPPAKSRRRGSRKARCWPCCFPSASFTVVSVMVDDLSSSGMDRITGEVEALRRKLDARIGAGARRQHLRALLHRWAVLCRGSRHLGHPLGARRHSADRRLGRRRSEIRDDAADLQRAASPPTAPSSC